MSESREKTPPAPRPASTRSWFLPAVIFGGLLGGQIVGMRELDPAWLTGGLGGLAGGAVAAAAMWVHSRQWPWWRRAISALVILGVGFFLIWDVASGVWLFRQVHKSLPAPSPF